MPLRPGPDSSASETEKPLADYAFVLLDCVDDGGQPTTSDVVKSRIRADVAKKSRAQRAANQAHEIRRSPLSVVDIFFGSELDAFKTLPSIPIESTKVGCFDSLKIYTLLCFSQHQVKSIMLPAACQNPCLFAAILLMAATSMNGMRITRESDPEILALRQETLLLVRQQLTSPDTSGAAEHVAAIQMLAGASFAYGFEPDVNFTLHLNALSTLLRAKGESRYKMTHLGRVILNMLVITNFTSWVTLGIPLDPYIGNFDLITGRAGRGLRGADWVSPLFWPESNPLFLKKFQSACDGILWELTRKTHELVELVTDEDTSGAGSAIPKLEALQSAIESFPTGEGKNNAQAKSPRVHRYECCRLTAVLMIRVASQGKAWSDAACGTSYAEEIMFSLSNSDPEDLWGDQVGLLYWVSLINYAVLHKTRHRLFGAGIVHRLISEVTFGDQDPRVGVHSLKRIGRFEEKCRNGGMTSSTEHGRPTKENANLIDPGPYHSCAPDIHCW